MRFGLHAITEGSNHTYHRRARILRMARIRDYVAPAAILGWVKRLVLRLLSLIGY